MVLGNPFYVSNQIAEEEEASCFTYPFMPNVFFPNLINWTSPYPIFGLLADSFPFLFMF